MPRSSAQPLAQSKGFTLIELLVAIAIMAVMAMLSWRGVDGMVRSLEQTRTRSVAVSRLSAGLSQWQADLEAVHESGQTPGMDFDGKTLRWVRRDADPQSAAVTVVAWTVRPDAGTTTGQWLRWQSKPLRTKGELDAAWLMAQQWSTNPVKAQQQQEVSIARASDWQIFFYRTDAWVNPQSSGATSASNVVAMPDAVRLILNLGQGAGVSGKLTKDWVRPIVGGGKS